jgi:amidohydrolase
MAACGGGAVAQTQPQSQEPAPWVELQADELVKIYKRLHAAPELSFAEVQTARFLAEELRNLGMDVSTQIGKQGVVGILKNGKGPTVMVRTDLDALPITEATGLEYASKVVVKDKKGNDVGAMHACGHDVHMTCLIGTARYLAAHREKWRGTVMFIGQPAEEIGSGALAMLGDGLFTRFPKPDYALALHVDAHMPVGRVGFRAGYFLANTDSVDVTLRGKGGHGAYPQTTIDPIVQAAQFVIELQPLVSREKSPFEPAVITVGSIHGGTKHNIIPDTCHLQLTVRSYSDKVRRNLLDGIRRKARAVAQGAGAPEPSIEITDGTPATFNDERLVGRLVPVFRRALGDENVVEVEQSMGGEDFSQYGLAGVPIFMFRLGSISAARIEEFAKASKPLPSLHSAEYYPDPRPTISTGVQAMAAAVVDLLAVAP